MPAFLIKKIEKFCKNPLTFSHFCGIIYVVKGGESVKDPPNKKLTTFEIATLIIQAVSVIVSLIAAIRWW